MSNDTFIAKIENVLNIVVKIIGLLPMIITAVTAIEKALEPKV